MVKLELPIRLKYEPIRTTQWEVTFTAPPQVYDYDEFVIDHFLHYDYS